MITEHKYVPPVNEAVSNTPREAQGRCQFPIGWELGPDGACIKDFHCCQSRWQHAV